jgi:hypothetical protein
MQDTRAERYTNPLAAIAAIMASLAIALAVLALAPRMVAAQDAPATPLRLLGEFIYPYGTTFQGLPVGELSGITYDQRRGVYYAVADERSMARFYTLAIDLGPQGIRDVRVTGMTLLDSDAAAPGIQPHERDDSDLEEIVLLPNGDLLISSERDRNNVPWIRRYRLDGTLLSELPLPAKFLPAADRGVRRNLAFEAMTASPDGATLLVANEQALAQDGPLATPDHGTNVRVLRYDLRGAPRPGSELVYVTERIFARPEPPGADADNGVTALLWVRHLLPPFDALALERSFVTGGAPLPLHGADGHQDPATGPEDGGDPAGQPGGDDPGAPPAQRQPHADRGERRQPAGDAAEPGAPVRNRRAPGAAAHGERPGLAAAGRRDGRRGRLSRPGAASRRKASHGET